MSSTKHVLYLTFDGLTDPLGQSQVLPYLEGLSKNGYAFTILSLDKSERYRKESEVIQKRCDQHNIKWVSLRYYQGIPLISPLLNIFRVLFLSFWIVVKEKVVMLHCRSYLSAMVGLLVKGILRRPYIFDMRGFWADERKDNGMLKSTFVYNFLKGAERRLIVHAAGIVSLTRSGIREMSSWSYVTPTIASRMIHITTCADIDRYDVAFQKTAGRDFSAQTFTLIYVGSFGPLHAKDHMLAFLGAVMTKYPLCKAVLVLSAIPKELETELTGHGLTKERIKVTSLPHHQIPDIMSEGDIGFFFIPPKYSKKASSPTKMGEMLAAGLPVITGPYIGDADELIEEGRIGYVVQEYTKEQYLYSLEFLIQLIKDDREGLRDRCRSVAESYFALSKGIISYRELYTRIIN